MFQDCTRLQSVKMLATEITDDGLTDWMSNVSATGTMITSGKLNLPKNSTSGIPTRWTELQYADPSALANKQETLVSGTNIKTINNQSILGSGNITIEGGGSSEPVDYSKEYLTIESLADDNDISITVKNNNVLSYSTDNGTTWTEGNSVTVNNGDKVLWKGSNLSCGIDGPCTFNSNRNVNVSGNIMSLEFGDEFVGKTTITKQYQFAGVFATFKVVNADNLILPATTLANWCYQSMFSSCRHLVKAPELPATALATNCYRNMFNNCIKLVKAPELPATALANSCYANMFNGCTSLTKAPELPATILISYCYTYMFNGCTALTKAPELPATVLESGCYNNMFTGCTALTKSPELSAPTLESYCYNNMFNGCTKLSYITMLATNISALGCLTNWASGVAASGTMITSGKVTLVQNSANGIPTGWTELHYADQAPDLSNYATNAQLQTVDNKVNAIDTNIDSIIDNLDNVTSTPTYTGTTTYSSVTELQNDSTIFKFVKKNRWTVWNDCIYDYANTDYAIYNAMIVIPVTFTDTNNMIKLSVESYASSNPVGSDHSLCVGYLTATGVSNVNSIDQSTTTGPSNTQNIPGTWYTVVNDLTSTLTPNGTWHIEDTEIVPEYKYNNTAYVFILGRYVAIRNITIAQSVKPASFDKCIQSTTPGLKIEVVNALPATPAANTIYLVRSVSYNLTTVNESELEPGQGTAMYLDANGYEITSASVGQKVDVNVGTTMNDNRPDYATEGVEGYWQEPTLNSDSNVEIRSDGEPGTGWFYMPANEVHCWITYTWVEDTPSEGGE